MPDDLTTLLLMMGFFVCGMLVGSLNIRRGSSLILTLAFVSIIVMLDNVGMLIVFFVGLTASSVLSDRMRKITQRRVKERTIKL